jgi:hypothetical protein
MTAICHELVPACQQIVDYLQRAKSASLHQPLVQSVVAGVI